MIAIVPSRKLLKSVAVRALTQKDVNAVREIDQLAFGANDQYEPEFYDSVVNSDTFDAFLLVDEYNTIIAWALIDLGMRPIRLRSLSVHPKFQRRGCGFTLVSHVLSKYPSSIDLVVNGENEAAIRLYRRLGFVLTAPDTALPDYQHMIIPRT